MGGRAGDGVPDDPGGGRGEGTSTPAKGMLTLAGLLLLLAVVIGVGGSYSAGFAVGLVAAVCLSIAGILDRPATRRR
jgi:hypothetical protein